jgi:cytochrome c oxidase subunit 2
LKTRTFLFLGGTAAFLLFLGGVGFAQDQDHPGVWLPYSASSYAEEIDSLYRLIFWVTAGMFFITEGLLLWFCVAYRRRPGHRPTYTHGNHKAEIAWTIVPAVMLLGLAIMQIGTWNKIKKEFPDKNSKDVTNVDFLGEQFKWNVRYPGTKAKYKGEFEYTNLSNVHMPFGNTAMFNLRSKDVIHSVFIPHMRVKQDTVPGLRQRLWFKPNRFFLADLKAPLAKEGEMYVLENGDWVKKDRMIQPKVWINLDAANPGKDFEQGGAYFEKRIAVQEHTELNGLYQVPTIKAKPTDVGVIKKVKVLHRGKVTERQEFSSCDYALGIFEIACAELCGLGHYTMRGFLYVEPPAVYDAWIKSEMEDVSKPPPAWDFWRD